MANDSLPDNQVIIYGLTDPVTTELRYVGKTHYNLSKRRKQHLNHSKNAGVVLWVVGLRARGYLPQAFEIERVTRANFVEAEQFWIDYFRSIGADLFNILPAAGGSVCHSPETKEKLAQMGLARMTPLERERRRQISLSRWSDLFEREKNIRALREFASLPETKEMRSRAKLRDWAENPEYRKNFAAAQSLVDRSSIAKEFWKRPGYRERHAAANLASNESRSASMKAEWVKRKLDKVTPASKMDGEMARQRLDDYWAAFASHIVVGG